LAVVRDGEEAEVEKFKVQELKREKNPRPTLSKPRVGHPADFTDMTVAMAFGNFGSSPATQEGSLKPNTALCGIPPLYPAPVHLLGVAVVAAPT
jgi:hypothetical protein